MGCWGSNPCVQVNSLPAMLLLQPLKLFSGGISTIVNEVLVALILLALGVVTLNKNSSKHYIF